MSRTSGARSVDSAEALLLLEQDKNGTITERGKARLQLAARERGHQLPEQHGDRTQHQQGSPSRRPAPSSSIALRQQVTTPQVNYIKDTHRDEYNHPDFASTTDSPRITSPLIERIMNKYRDDYNHPDYVSNTGSPRMRRHDQDAALPPTIHTSGPRTPTQPRDPNTFARLAPDIDGQTTGSFSAPQRPRPQPEPVTPTQAPRRRSLNQARERGYDPGRQGTRPPRATDSVLGYARDRNEHLLAYETGIRMASEADFALRRGFYEQGSKGGRGA